MKLRTTPEYNERRRAPAACTVLAIGLVSGALSFGGLAFGEGGGTPINDQGVDWRAQRHADVANNTGIQAPVTRERQRRVQENNGDRGYRADRGYRGDYRYGDRGYRGDYRYGDHRGYSDRRYYGDRGYRYEPRYRSYAYGSPYLYAPAPLAYDPYPTPGISLFFGF